MKKILLFLLLSLSIMSCEDPIEDGKQHKKSNGITYFKDETTNLCFAKIASRSADGYRIASIACVPCDSLKKIGIK